MRTLYSLIRRTTICLTIVSFMALMCGGVSLAQSNGNDEHLSKDSSKDMSPGWLNADLYKTYKIKEVKKGEAGTQAGKETEHLEQELGQSLAEDTTTKVKPDLKMKTGGNEEADESEYNVPSLEERGLADLNGDGVVTVEDGDGFRDLIFVWEDDPRYIKAYDLNNNGRIDFLDWSIVRANLGVTYDYGDAYNMISTDMNEDTYMRSWNRPGRELRDQTSPSYYISFGTGNTSTSISNDKLKSVFSGLMANKNALAPDAAGVLDPELIAKLLEDALSESALSLSVSEMDPQAMEVATMLANIFNDPTAEQEMVVDVLESIMNETQKLEEETDNTELKESSDDFTEMVATVLLAQAMPDLLKEGDISNIKGVFGELATEKGQILREYNDSVKSYRSNVVKELAANIVTLQIKDILSRDLTEKELEKFPAQRIDEIVSKIRNVKDKTITEEQILRQEAKYREEYLTPAKQILEKNMKTLLRDFTRKLFGVLNEAGLVKEKTTDGKPVLGIDLSAR